MKQQQTYVLVVLCSHNAGTMRRDGAAETVHSTGTQCVTNTLWAPGALLLHCSLHCSLQNLAPPCGRAPAVVPSTCKYS